MVFWSMQEHNAHARRSLAATLPSSAAVGPHWLHLAERVRLFVELTKPRITLMVLVSACGGALLAPAALPADRLALLLVVLAGVVGAANALNCWLERDSDRLMARTADRPLPTRRLASHSGLLFGLALAIVSVPLLGVAVNPLTGALGALALLSYVAVYTPLKRISPLALHVGAVPGALPPLMGWTAATGSIEVPGLTLFLVMFFWQLPHFSAIAMFRRDEYARANLQVVTLRWTDRLTRAHALATTALLTPLSLVLYTEGVVGIAYACAATGLGLWFLAVGVWVWRPVHNKAGARKFFFASLVYLTGLFAALVIDGLWAALSSASVTGLVKNWLPEVLLQTAVAAA